MESNFSIQSLARERSLERDLEFICNSMIKDLTLIRDNLHVDNSNIGAAERIYNHLYKAETLLLRSRIEGNILS